MKKRNRKENSQQGVYEHFGKSNKL